MLIVMYLLGIIFGACFYSLWLDICANTDDLRVMRSKDPKRIKKYNEDQKLIDEAILRQVKLARITQLENKLK